MDAIGDQIGGGDGSKGSEAAGVGLAAEDEEEDEKKKKKKSSEHGSGRNCEEGKWV